MNCITIDSIINIDVSDACYESYPCYHRLVITLNSGKQIRPRWQIGAVDILYLFVMTGLPVPEHFLQYRSMKRQLNHIENIDFDDRVFTYE